MSPAKRRQRRPRSQAAAPDDGAAREELPQPKVAPGVVPMPKWQWKTFPVFFALAFGLFVGTWVGGLSGFVAGDQGDSTPLNIAYVVSAILMGAALSRFMTRWMISRQWIKPRPQKASRKK
ncbi:MAG: hypothetical protein ACM3S1_06480 [Hyphomicrobiales bacterium]